MTHQDNVAAVRAACIAANPEILACKCFVCGSRFSGKDECPFCGGNAACHARPEITLPDVLLALGDSRTLVRWDDRNGALVIPMAKDGESARGAFHWLLPLPLSDQSEEAVAALAALLKRDD